MYKLSARQREILDEAMQGCTTRESAFRHQLAVSTVKTHRSRILRTLGAATMAEAAAIYLRDIEVGRPSNQGDEEVSA
jgi:DNA-binding NarL/FixJ family response regulator